MGAIRECKPVLLLIAAFAASEEAMQRGKELAEREFGPIALESKTYRFDDFTPYYAKEMGEALPKRFWVFQKALSRGYGLRPPHWRRLFENQSRALRTRSHWQGRAYRRGARDDPRRTPQFAASSRGSSVLRLKLKKFAPSVISTINPELSGLVYLTGTTQ